MISKLVTWAEDRPRAIARMRRALGEYLVVGIRTTVPFFTWLLEQADFVEGKFHTAYLDDVLAGRSGQPFVTASADIEDVAAIGVIIKAIMRHLGADAESIKSDEAGAAESGDAL